MTVERAERQIASKMELIVKDTIELPEGLDWDTIHAAVEAVEAWELRADGLATELAIELFRIFNRGRP